LEKEDIDTAEVADEIVTEVLNETETDNPEILFEEIIEAIKESVPEDLQLEVKEEALQLFKAKSKELVKEEGLEPHQTANVIKNVVQTLAEINDLLCQGVQQQFDLSRVKFAEEAIRESPFAQQAQSISPVYIPVLQKTAEGIAKIATKKMLEYLDHQTIGDKIGDKVIEDIAATYNKTQDIQQAVDKLKVVFMSYYKDGINYIEELNPSRLFAQLWPSIWSQKAGELQNKGLTPEQVEQLSQQLLRRGQKLDATALEKKLQQLYEQLISQAFREYDQQVTKKLNATLQSVLMHSSMNVRSFCA